MAYQTLYRKYRPKSFELVFGQNTITKTLTNIIKNNMHIYLLVLEELVKQVVLSYLQKQ